MNTLDQKRFDERRAALARKFEFFQNISGWSTKSDNHSRYASLLKTEIDLLCDEAYANLYQCYMLHEIIVRRQYLLKHANDMDRITFSQFWSALNRQEAILNNQV